jgi:hypothetical protein
MESDLPDSHLYLERFVFLVYEITRHMAIAMYTVIVDISKKKGVNITCLYDIGPFVLHEYKTTRSREL